VIRLNDGQRISVLLMAASGEAATANCDLECLQAPPSTCAKSGLPIPIGPCKGQNAQHTQIEIAQTSLNKTSDRTQLLLAYEICHIAALLISRYCPHKRCETLSRANWQASLIRFTFSWTFDTGSGMKYIAQVDGHARNPLNTSGDRKPRKTRSNPILVFLGVTLLILVGVTALNYWLNPLTYNHTEQQKAAKLLAAGHSIAIPDSNLDWRELRREHIRLMPTSPDVVIFGGSRWQEATGDVAPGKHVYNAFVSNDHFEDMMAIAELLDASKRMPKTLVLSVRFSTFEYLDRREAWWWKSFSPEYRAMAERLGVTPHSRWNLSPAAKWGHLLSGDALLNKLKQYRMVETRWRLADSAPDPVLDVVGPDGALQFSSRHLHITTPDYAEEDATNAAAAQRAKRLKINQELLGQFEKLLLFLKNREVRVVLAQTPFHPAFLNGIKGSAYHEDLMRIEREINSIAARTGTTVVGSFDAVKEGCDRSDYRDFNHSSVRCLRRLVAQISDL
jgi:hypothetical protein